MFGGPAGKGPGRGSGGGGGWFEFECLEVGGWLFLDSELEEFGCGEARGL